MTTAVHPLDKEDPLAHKRAAFHIPANTILFRRQLIGLNGTKCPRTCVNQALRHEWGDDVITSWNKHGWIDLPLTVGDKIGRLIGAPEGQTICCDSTSINLFKVLCAALQINSDRSEILSTTDNFPTDLYMVQGIEQWLGERCKLRLVSEDSLLNEINENTAVVLVTEVNFRTGRRLPMAHISQRAKQCGALTVVDLAHSAGALPVDVVANEIDFAVGCTYKYFNCRTRRTGVLICRRAPSQTTAPASAPALWLARARSAICIRGQLRTRRRYPSISDRHTTRIVVSGR